MQGNTAKLATKHTARLGLSQGDMVRGAEPLSRLYLRGCPGQDLWSWSGAVQAGPVQPSHWLCGAGLRAWSEMAERVAGGLQCLAFLPSTWDIHTETSPALCTPCAWCYCRDGLAWPGRCGGAAVHAPMQSAEEVNALGMLWGSSEPWLFSGPQAAPRQPPHASSKTQRGPGGCAWLSLGIACLDPMPVTTEPQCWQDAADAKGLLTKRLTCSSAPHVSQCGRGCEGWFLHPIALDSFLAHGAVAEGCQIWMQDVPDWRQRGVKEMQVGGASLG